MKCAVEWEGLIDRFQVDGIGEYKVVRKAVGKAPWGGKIKAELLESEFDLTVIVSLPDFDGCALALLSGLHWEIWVTPKNEIHVVRPRTPPHPKYPPDEYLFISEEPKIKRGI